MKPRKKRKSKNNGKRHVRQPSRKLRLKRAVKAAAKAIWKHLVELPEKEREQNLATIKRVLTKKLKRAARRK